jgi:DNA polymerase III epsilon subunit-like protein
MHIGRALRRPAPKTNTNSLTSTQIINNDSPKGGQKGDIVSGYAVIDVETTGLNWREHVIWELGVCLVDKDGRDELENAMQLEVSPVVLQRADPRALEIGGYWERFLPGAAWSRHEAARQIAEWLRDRQIVAQPALFDVSFVQALLWEEDVAQTWSHRAVHDLKTWARGRENGLATNAPQGQVRGVGDISTDELARLAGIEIPEGRHSALVDARLTRDIARSLGVFAPP